MTNKRHTISVPLMLALVSLVAGCNSVDQPSTATTTQPPQERFQQPQSGPTAVESAIELSRKYAELAEEMAALQNENQRLAAENQALKDQLSPCRTELQQTQKELAEANDLLVEMRVELNNWKTDVLGFRDEIREANKAQIEALLKIIKVLGGEISIQPTPEQNVEPDNTVPKKPDEALQ